MLDISSLVNDATLRAHRAICTEEGVCSGPAEVEVMITAFVLESTLPAILAGISQEFKQALHSMAAGNLSPGDPDALAENSEDLLAEWFRWYREDFYETTFPPPTSLAMRTTAYLTARAVQQGKVVRTTADL